MKCPRTILIVDDEEKIVEVLRVYLKKEGYQVLCAYDGTTAMKLFRSSNINETSLILLDLMLPDIMGEQVCRSIRTVSRVPIIMPPCRMALLSMSRQRTVKWTGICVPTAPMNAI